MIEKKIHRFHIPVLGIGYSVDSPLRVAKYGISSVISLVDDELIEKLRNYYEKKTKGESEEISKSEDDSRAKRIKSYLDMMNSNIQEQIQALKKMKFEVGNDLSKYFEMLPDFNELKAKYKEMIATTDLNLKERLSEWLKENIKPGSIDVNIMTKLDKSNYKNGEKLDNEYNDAHAALRGFAESNVEGTIVMSAGMNPRLYGYMTKFKDFYPDSFGNFKKRIAIKVSDYRSALIQGKFLAKKGLWVSEYRIESGLNCGGHAFASEGHLLGPILEEFHSKKEELLLSIKELYKKAIEKMDVDNILNKLNFELSVQGGVGTKSEQDFLLRRYEIDSVGWGTPFMLVPEAISIDEDTLEKLEKAKEEDIFLSDASPLGVKFSNLRTSGKQKERKEKAEKGNPGFPCLKRFLESNNEYSVRPICTASRVYLKNKINDLKSKYMEPALFQKEYDKVAQKECLCVGLTEAALLEKGLEKDKTNSATTVCPGPNIAYFNKRASLKEMVDHIYGRTNLLSDENRPNMFVKELSLYVDYFHEKIEESIKPFSGKTEVYLKSFKDNLLEGIDYYRNLLPDLKEESEKMRRKIREDLEELEKKLLLYSLQIS